MILYPSITANPLRWLAAKTAMQSFPVQMSNDNDLVILDWNVRGLNNPGRRQVLKEMVADQQCRIVCIQETKVHNMDSTFIQSCLGHRFVDSYASQPANGTRGGLLLALSKDLYSILQVDVRRFSVTVQVKRTKDKHRVDINRGLRTAKRQDRIPARAQAAEASGKSAVWLLLGNFNLIYRSCDKSNTRINRRLMQSFRAMLNELEMKDFHLHGRRFTWSSGTANPTQTKIDHVFSTRDWRELSHGAPHLQALGSSMSDHCPLLLTCSHALRKYRGFRFEAYWLKFSDFNEQVINSWSRSVNSGNKARALHIKLARLAKDLKHWNKTRIAALKKESADAQQRVLLIKTKGRSQMLK
jgi:exonuclease III